MAAASQLGWHKRNKRDNTQIEERDSKDSCRLSFVGNTTSDGSWAGAGQKLSRSWARAGGGSGGAGLELRRSWAGAGAGRELGWSWAGAGQELGDARVKLAQPGGG